jgi:transposase
MLHAAKRNKKTCSKCCGFITSGPNHDRGKGKGKGKGKVVAPVLFLTEHRAMKA